MKIARLPLQGKPCTPLRDPITLNQSSSFSLTQYGHREGYQQFAHPPHPRLLYDLPSKEVPNLLIPKMTFTNKTPRRSK